LSTSTTVAAVGPLTNVAAALGDPAHQVRELYIMGGNFVGDRVEHNIRCDADAAAAVFSAGVATTVVGLDQTTRVRIDNAVAAELEACGAFGALLAAEIRQFWDFTGEPSNVPHDPIAIVMITDPELFAFHTGRVVVTTTGDDPGHTAFTVEEGGPHRIAVDLDVESVSTIIRDRMLNVARSAG
jgi:purine nucleosidase